jgi:hypothetical protein
MQGVFHPVETHKQIVAVDDDVMNQQNMMKWCREVSKGRTNVHDEQRSGRLSFISDNIIQKIEGEIHASWCEIRELHHIIPKVSKTTIHAAVKEKLRQRKLCTLDAQNVNRRSQNEMDGFCAEVSHALRTGRR